MFRPNFIVDAIGTQLDRPVITAIGNHDSGEHGPGWGVEQV